MTDQREAVARIIDPTAYWGDPSTNAEQQAALANANAILSTLGSQAVEPEREGLEPARPLIEAIAAWERENGTIAAILPHEYDGFMRLLTRAAITGSARAALSGEQEAGAEAKATVEHGSANSHVFDDQIIVAGECVAFADEPWATRIAASLSVSGPIGKETGR